MVKFRCPVCAQKILCNNEGIGAAIPCPNCAYRIVVPAETDPEFRGQLLRYAGPPQLIALTPPPPAHPDLRAALLPHLARLMMDKLVQALVAQRRELVHTQQTGTTQLAEIEQRLVALQRQHGAQIKKYEQRIFELECRLTAQEEERRELIRDRLQLTSRAMQNAAAR